MHTNNRVTESFDRAGGCTPHWSAADAGHGPRSIGYPPQAASQRQQAAPRPPGHRSGAGNAGNDPPSHGVTPTQWLRQWCCLDEQT